MKEKVLFSSRLFPNFRTFLLKASLSYSELFWASTLFSGCVSFASLLSFTPFPSPLQTCFLSFTPFPPFILSLLQSSIVLFTPFSVTRFSPSFSIHSLVQGCDENVLNQNVLFYRIYPNYRPRPPSNKRPLLFAPVYIARDGGGTE